MFADAVLWESMAIALHGQDAIKALEEGVRYAGAGYLISFLCSLKRCPSSLVSADPQIIYHHESCSVPNRL